MRRVLEDCESLILALYPDSHSVAWRIALQRLVRPDVICPSPEIGSNNQAAPLAVNSVEMGGAAYRVSG
jgi:hypothetical protein